jgi:hypothetical protein
MLLRLLSVKKNKLTILFLAISESEGGQCQ